MPFCRARLSAKRFIAGVGGYPPASLPTAAPSRGGCPYSKSESQRNHGVSLAFRVLSRDRRALRLLCFRAMLTWHPSRRSALWPNSNKSACCSARALFIPPRMIKSLGPYDITAFAAQYPTPHDCCVRFAMVIAFHSATLATGRRYPLPGPDSHRLDLASFLAH